MKTIKKQFEKSLDTYNDNAIVQKFMAKELVSKICDIKSEFENILELGCGTGLLTSEISSKLSYKKYFANDIVEKSEKYIRKIFPDAIFLNGDARKIKPTQKMDLIISNALFQWFENLEKIEEMCYQTLSKDGILAFTSFLPDNYKEIKELTNLSLSYKNIEEIEKIFNKRLNIIETKLVKQVLHFSTPLEMLAHMKNTGVNSLTSKHWTIKDVKDFCDKYKQKFPNIQLTYSGIIVICKK